MVLLGLSGASAPGCGDAADPCEGERAECAFTADCGGGLTCLDGVCRRPCRVDDDCEVTPREGCGAAEPSVCERQWCQPACRPGDCSGAELCHRGRCVLGFEDFETQPSLGGLGWNRAPGQVLANPTHRVVRAGLPGCALGGDDCAGPAASGDRFVLVGTQPTSEKGTARTAPSCRPCACCLACVADPYAEAPAVDACPVPPQSRALFACPAVPPASCRAVCEACDRCEPAPAARAPGPNLLPCEARAAERSCPACVECDAGRCEDCRSEACAEACQDPGSEACVRCESASCPGCAVCRACAACGIALACEQDDPGSARCRRAQQTCAAQARDGCFPVPVGFPRAELRPIEQALVSPPLGLTGREPVELSFAWVAFGVGETYFESRQGVPSEAWAEVPQEVRVQWCATGCAEEAGWRPALWRTGGEARFPPPGARHNGLGVGRQSAVDWRSGRSELVLPPEARTPETRIRFLPRLAPEARVGLDDLRWRDLR